LLLAEGVNATLAVLTDSVAAPMVGADGTAGVLKFGPMLGALVPTAFVAVNVAEQTVLFGMFVAVIGELVPDTILRSVLPEYTLAVTDVIGLPPLNPVVYGI
jgi:hypothetical protein